MGRFDDDDPTTYGTLSPEETLSLIGNEVRAEILWALSDARGGVGSPPVLSFSELRSRVDADVDSSQFNYHLQQLVGHFVERRQPHEVQDGLEFRRWHHEKEEVSSCPSPAREEKRHEPTARVRVVDSVCARKTHKASEGSHTEYE